MDKFTYQQSPEETDAMLIYEMEEEYHKEQALIAETEWKLAIEEMEKPSQTEKRILKKKELKRICKDRLPESEFRKRFPTVEYYIEQQKNS